MQHKMLHVKGMIQTATYVRMYTEEFRPHSSPSTVPRVYCAVGRPNLNGTAVPVRFGGLYGTSAHTYVRTVRL